MRRLRCTDLRLPATAGLPSPTLFKNFRIVHICGMRRDVKILAVSKPDKKWRNMYRLTSVGCRSSLDADRTWQRRDFPNPCRFPDGAISFPVKLQKIPCSDAQGISEYLVEIAELFDAFTWPRNTQRAKIPCIFPASRDFPVQLENSAEPAVNTWSKAGRFSIVPNCIPKTDAGPD